LSEVTFMIPITGPKVSSRMIPRVSYRECRRQEGGQIEERTKRLVFFFSWLFYGRGLRETGIDVNDQ